jgi:wyosine [tRNA(Phe)-imidazoG37] synthetase (radical SAM superfamily)
MLKTVYGPVPSWRLGRSLGIDPVCKRKVCSFDCIYCQLGRTTEKTPERRVFVESGRVKKDLGSIWKSVRGKADVVTLSGTGEPELAENLGELIEIAREVTGLRVAVLTNSSLMDREDVREDLAKADIVVAKLDAPNPEIFAKIDQPHPSIKFGKMIEGMKRFRQEFKGKYAIQIMFLDLNKDYAAEIRKLAEEIRPDEVQIDTPIRHSPVRPLGPEEVNEIKNVFGGMNYISVYDRKRPEVETIDSEETFERRPE